MKKRPIKMMQCEFCNKETPYRQDKGIKRKYCSRECYYNARAQDYMDKTVHYTLRWCCCCRKHLPSELFYGTVRQCKNCTVRKGGERGKNLKKKLIVFLGGKCNRCGYNSHPAPFHFHHKQPELKTKTWGQMRGRSWSILQEWAMKENIECICANCHAKEHANF